jgi:hypothetical protein
MLNEKKHQPKQIVQIEKVFNIFNSQFVRTSVPKGEIPESKILFPLNEYIEKIEFKPKEYITPTEAIIQRVILGIIKTKFDAFIGTAGEFQQHEFHIYISEVESKVGKKNISREIHKSLIKLKEMDIDLTLAGKNAPKQYGSIVNDISHFEGQGYYGFMASQLFQTMRLKKFRDEAKFDVIGLDFKKVHIQPTEFLELNKIQQQAMLFFLCELEDSNWRVISREYELDNKFYLRLFNTKKISKNQPARFKESIRGLIEMSKYKDMFEFIGTKTLKVNFQ